MKQTPYKNIYELIKIYSHSIPLLAKMIIITISTLVVKEETFKFI